MVYYELLKSGETVNTKRYQQQLTNLNRSLFEKRPGRGNQSHFSDNSPSHMAKLVRDTSERLSWDVLSLAAYSPDLAPSDYHLSASKGHALAKQRFGSCEDVKKRLVGWFTAKEEDFTNVVITNCPNNWKNVKQAMEYSLNKTFFIILRNLTSFLGEENPHFLLVHLVCNKLQELVHNKQIKIS